MSVPRGSSGSPGTAAESQPLTAIWFRQHIFFTLDPCLYLALAKSRGGGDLGGQAQGPLPGPFSLCTGFHQFPRNPLFHAPNEISFASFQRT